VLDKPLIPLPAVITQRRERQQRLLAGTPLSAVTATGRTTEAVVRAAAQALSGVTDHLNQLDALAGDGDTGSTVGLAASTLLSAPQGAFSGPSDQALEVVATLVRNAVGGSLGGLYNLGLTAAAAALPKDRSATPAEFATAMQAGLRAVQVYGNARSGSRTMLDALLPACEALSRAVQEGAGGAAAARAAATAAQIGADATKGMAAEAGRASYTRGTALLEADPGAVAVAVWMEAVAKTLESAAA